MPDCIDLVDRPVALVLREYDNITREQGWANLDALIYLMVTLDRPKPPEWWINREYDAGRTPLCLEIEGRLGEYVSKIFSRPEDFKHLAPFAIRMLSNKKIRNPEECFEPTHVETETASLLSFIAHTINPEPPLPELSDEELRSLTKRALAITAERLKKERGES